MGRDIHLPLHQAAQNTIQPGFEHFYGWGIQNLFQCLNTPRMNNFFLMFNPNPASFILKTLSLVLQTQPSWCAGSCCLQACTALWQAGSFPLPTLGFLSHCPPWLPSHCPPWAAFPLPTLGSLPTAHPGFPSHCSPWAACWLPSSQAEHSVQPC